MSTNNPFGLSTWLADELYQEYKKDPQSVDKEWRELFDKHGAPSDIAASSESAASASDSTKAQGGKEAADIAPPTQKSLAHKQQQRESVVEESAQKAKSKVGADKRGVAPKAPKKAPSPLDDLPDYDGGESKPLKGMFKAIAKNMDESLEIPTATSVRDIPVKLMWENRSLINEHLKLSLIHI